MSNITKYMLAAVTFLMIILALTSRSTPVRAQGKGKGSQPWRLVGNAQTDPTSNFLGTTDEQSLVIRTNAQERVRVTDGGRVGIGTASPDAQLHVLAGNGEDSLVVRHAGDDHPDLLIDADSNVGINISDPSARFVIRNDSFGQRPLMSVLAGDATPFHMSSAGSVTIDPVGAGVALRVRASSSSPNFNTTPIPFYVSAADDANAIYVTREGNVGIGTAGEGINDQLRIRGGENTGSSAAVRIVSGANQQTMLLDGNEIDAVNAGLFLNHNSAENVILATGGGNVGVGTSNPNSRFSVRDQNHQIAIVDSDNSNKTWTLTSHQASSGFGIWENGQGGQGRLVIESGGDVGIGTTNPATRLHVQGSSDGTDLLVRDTVFARTRMVATQPDSDVILTVQARGSANAERAEIGTVSNHDLVLFSNGTPRIVIDASGAVCIGNC